MKTFYLILSGLAMLATVGLATGCVGSSHNARAGHDWYSGDTYKMVSKVEHERKFPQGHKLSGPEDTRNCVYNQATTAYFCQFDWSE